MSELKAVPQQTPAEKQFVIGEKAVNDLFAAITELKWKEANPLIQFLQRSLSPLEEPKAEEAKAE